MLKRWRDALIVGYLAVQVVVPLRGVLQGKLDTRGDFSWNMYTQRYVCATSYVLTKPDGEQATIDHRQFFRRAERATKVFHRDTLPRLHEYLCRGYEERGELGTITATVRCSLNFGEWVPLVAPGDICTADNWGVVPG